MSSFWSALVIKRPSKKLGRKGEFLIIQIVTDGSQMERSPDLLKVIMVNHLPRQERAYTVMCVEVIGDKLQLHIRAYGMGMEVLFQPKTKIELIEKWIDFGAWENHDVGLIFDSAFLRLIPDYISRKELQALRAFLCFKNNRSCICN